VLIYLSSVDVASRGRAKHPPLMFIRKQNKTHTVLPPSLPLLPAKSPA
jgi:hypothetical protein